MTTEKAVITVRDLEGARELGRLSGEVRVLKWGVAIIAPMMFAYLTFLSYQINGVRNDLTQQINVMQEGQAVIRERITVIEQTLIADSL